MRQRLDMKFGFWRLSMNTRDEQLSQKRKQTTFKEVTKHSDKVRSGEALMRIDETTKVHIFGGDQHCLQ